MSTHPISISAAGLVTGVGLNAPSTCAAIRCGLNNFRETRFTDAEGNWLRGSTVTLEHPWRRTVKLAKMLTRTIAECAAECSSLNLATVPILFCLPEKERPGRSPDDVRRIIDFVQRELNLRLHESSGVLEHGRVGAVTALAKARSLIFQNAASRPVDRVLIASVDSFLDPETLNSYEQQGRIVTTANSDGFIPGEAASTVLVERPRSGPRPQLLCLGIGFGTEEATIASETPLRASGLSAAIRTALVEAALRMEDLDFRITDVSGEQYGFKEATLVLGRLLRAHKESFPIWHPSDCVGEVGAAIGGVIMAWTRHAALSEYAPGPNVLHHYSNTDRSRAAAVFGIRILA